MMKVNAVYVAVVLAGAASLAGCSGASSPQGSALPTTQNAPVKTPLHRRHMTKVGLRIVIPPKHRHHHRRRSGIDRPQYLTPAVSGVGIDVLQAANQYSGFTFFALTPQSTYCTGDGVNTALTCTLDLQAPAGNDTFVVDTWDSQYWYDGRIISTGTLTQNISLQQANNINITTEGVVSNVQISLDNNLPAVGSSFTTPIRITALDADAYAIVGDFDQPLQLSDVDPTGTTHVSATSLASSSDFTGLTYSYTGGQTGSATPYVQVEAQSPASLTNGGPFIAQAILYPGNDGVLALPSLLHFASPSASGQSMTVSAVGAATAPFTVSTSAYGCTGIVNVTGTSPTFTVTPAGAGVCDLVVYDSSSAPYQEVVPVSVSPGTVP